MNNPDTLEKGGIGLPNRRKHLSIVVLACLAILFTIALVVYPEQGMDAAIAGLKVFWDVVFPSLLPFFILSELLLGLGIVNAFGVILEPLMRPLFSVPGVGAFALSMGLAAGYPMDAVITAKFRQGGLCTRIEGERLLAFTNTADPLFMFGAVAVGMFKSPQLGILLAIAHYISSLIVGVTFKLYGRKEERFIKPMRSQAHQGKLFLRAYRAMIQAHIEDARPFGKLLGDAVNDSIRTLLMIGGFIIFFSVFLRVLTQVGVVALVAIPLTFLFEALHMSIHLVPPFIAGLLEIDIGSAATAAANAPLIEKVSIASAIIAWSGLSVHAQVASVLTNTDIRMRPYFIARIYHALLAGSMTYILFRFGIGTKVVTYIPKVVTTIAPSTSFDLSHWFLSISEVGAWVALLLGCMLLSLAIYIVMRLKITAWYSKTT